MQTEISKLIEKKKAEALLNAYQKEYTEALKNQAKATENLVSLKQQLKEKISELVNANGKERAEIQLSISAISHQIKEESEQISQYGYTIQNYEALQEACVSGSAEALEKATEQMVRRSNMVPVAVLLLLHAQGRHVLHLPALAASKSVDSGNYQVCRGRL